MAEVEIEQRVQVRIAQQTLHLDHPPPRAAHVAADGTDDRAGPRGAPADAHRRRGPAHRPPPARQRALDRAQSLTVPVPVHFQTPEYARAIITAANPGLSEPEVKRRVDLRMERQKVLDREPDPPQVWSVLDEAALRRPVGGPEVMRAQLHHLVKLAQRPTIDLQVLPMARGAHAGLDGTFTVLDFPLELLGDPGTVYVQTRRKGVYYEEAAEIDEYRQTLTRLQAEAATPAESLLMIAHIAEEMTA